RGIEAFRIPGLIDLVVTLAFLKGFRQKRPRFLVVARDRIDSPVDANAELHVTKGIISSRRGPTIFRDRDVLYIGFDPLVMAIRPRKMVIEGMRALAQQLSS